jgi:Leucine Rich Repeat (LRR) protein
MKTVRNNLILLTVVLLTSTNILAMKRSHSAMSSAERQANEQSPISVSSSAQQLEKYLLLKELLPKEALSDIFKYIMDLQSHYDPISAVRILSQGQMEEVIEKLDDNSIFVMPLAFVYNQGIGLDIDGVSFRDYFKPLVNYKKNANDTKPVLPQQYLQSILASLESLIGENVLKLDLGSQEITKLPDGIGFLKNLKTLVLNSNYLITLPDSFRNLANLKNFDFSYNTLTKLPAPVYQLGNLKKLYLCNNRLKELLDAFGNLVHLIWLDLSFNGLAKLPESFGNLLNLKALLLNNNKLTTLPESFGNLIKLETMLLLNNNELEKLPRSFRKLNNLEMINLNNNQLTELPDMSNFSSLVYLFICNNNLTEIFESIGLLYNLQTLILSGNELTELPDLFCQLTKLEKLALYGNQLNEAAMQMVCKHFSHLGDNLDI